MLSRDLRGPVLGAAAWAGGLLVLAVPHQVGVLLAAGALLALGVLAGAHVGGDALLLVGTAALGSFTTFSGWMLESVRMGARAAAWNLGVSLVVGLGAVALGHAIGALL